MVSPRLLMRSTMRAVPSTDGPSSSEVMRNAIEPECRGLSSRNISAATTKAAREDFMSAAPRPYRRPSRSVGTKGSECHSESGPVGTTSVWPARQTSGRPAPRRAQRLVTSPNTSDSHWKPARPRRSARSAWQPPSSGVTDLRPISALESARTPLCSGIHVDFKVVEAREGFLLVLGGLGGWSRRAVEGKLARGGLVDEPQHVARGVGVRERLVLGDLAFHEELEERLLEGLRAGGEALLQRL